MNRRQNTQDVLVLPAPCDKFAAGLPNGVLKSKGGGIAPDPHCKRCNEGGKSKGEDSKKGTEESERSTEEAHGKG